MENLKEYIDTRIEEAYLETCRFYKLDLEKINSIEDCKKNLKIFMQPNFKTYARKCFL